MAPLPCVRICCNSCFMQAQTPRRLTPFTRSKFSAVSSAASLGGTWMPALLKAMSSLPKCATARSIMFATCASFETSQTTDRTLHPADVSFSAAACSAFSLISASTTAAPEAAKASAVASPMPELAPVTRATWPLKSYVGFIKATSLRFCSKRDWRRLHQLERLHHLLHRRLVFLEMIRSEVDFVSLPIAINLEDLDACRVVFLGHRVKHQDAPLFLDRRADLLLDCGPVGVQLSGIDLDLRHLDILSARLLGDGGAAQRDGEHRCAVDQKLLHAHASASRGRIRTVADRARAPIIGSR